MSEETWPSSAQQPLDEASSDRLDSWKDIAAYLKRDVSTVQRWEKREAMPVHRHLHDKLGTVYAYRSEVDTWCSGRGVELPPQDPTDMLPAAPLAEGTMPLPRPRSWAHRRLILLGAVVLSGLATVGLMLLIGRPAEGVKPDRASVSARRINPAAYEAVARARYLSVRTTDADNKAAIALLERAIALDPGFARAYAELAAAYVTRLAYVTPNESRELEEKAFAATEKALSIDPDLPEAYLARGDLLWTHSQRFAAERAVKEFRRALSLDPKSDQAHRRLARVFVHIGFFDEAIQHAEAALAINPTNAQALNTRAQATLWMGKDEEALAMLSSIPGPVLPELVEANSAFALLRLGRRQEAWTHLGRALAKYPDDPSGNLPAMQALLLADSEPHKAENLIEKVARRKAVNPSHHAAYFAAAACARMGHAADAVRWLREAADTGFPCYPLFARDPNLDRIRQHPEFVAFMAEMQRQFNVSRNALFTGR